MLASSFLGGAMLGWGGLLMTVVAGGCANAVAPGAVALIKGAVFPVGLSMITLSGSELLTGNMLTQSLPPISTDRAGPVARVLTWSFLGNFAGSLAVVGMVWAGGVFPMTGPVATGAMALAISKTSLAPSAAFIKGVGANW
jgi:formate/nitrite transporter FocA (FNT family)